MVVNILALVAVLGVLVFLHEGGHFLLARLVGAPVSIFSFGFGKRLFGVKRGFTDYRVSLIPLGGYVRIHGMGPDESGAPDPETPLLARWRRSLILLAGPGANVIGAIAFVALAFVVGVQVPAWQDQTPRIAWIDPASPAAQAKLQPGDTVLSIDGKPMATWRDVEIATLSAPGRALTLRVRRDGAETDVVVTPRSVTRYDLGYAGLAPEVPAEIQSVNPNSPAQRCGLEKGDKIKMINGEKIAHFYDLMRIVSANPGKELTLVIERGGKELTLRATPRDEGGVGKLGIPVPNPMVLKRLGAFAAVREGVTECWRMTLETFSVIGRMVTGRASIKQMSGPIDIARFSGEAARTGAVQLIWLLGVISLQLAIFNLLPIPVLDGGHLAIIAVESTIRRDFSDRTKERILNIGFWLIIALVVVVLFNDVTKNLPPGLERLIPGKK